MPFRCPSALALTILLIVCAAGQAHSAPGQTLMLGLSSSDSATADQQDIEHAIARAIGSLTALRDERDLDLPTALDLLGCAELDDACAEELLDLFEVNAVVVPELTRENGLLALRVRHISRTRPEAGFDISTTLDRPAAALDLQGRARSWLQGQASVEVRSQPDGLVVKVDGVVRGQTPLLLTELGPGAHRVTVDHDGASGERRIVVHGPAHHDVRFAPTDISRPAVLTPRRTAAIALLTASAGSTAGGIAFASALGRTQTRFDETFLEREAHDLARQGRKQALGANLLFATAIVTGATGTLLLILPGPGTADERPVARLRPAANPHFVGASIEFGR